MGGREGGFGRCLCFSGAQSFPFGEDKYDAILTSMMASGFKAPIVS